MTVTEALQKRRATPSFDTSVTITPEQIKAAIDKAVLSPSSMNLQPWEVLACLTDEDKRRLQSVSFNQRKIAEASAMLVILGDLHHHLHHAPAVAEGNVERGYITEDRVDRWVQSAHDAYVDPRTQRDEVFRGGSLFAMALMLALEEAGWDTAPMGGFEADKLIAEFGLPETHIPILLIAIGKINPDVQLKPRGYRFSADQIWHEGNY